MSAWQFEQLTVIIDADFRTGHAWRIPQGNLVCSDYRPAEVVLQCCIARDVPAAMLGGPVIGVWASISRYQDGILMQLDRGGNPTINPFINPDGEKNLFNSRQPADDVANYLGPWSKILENAGGYSPEAARAAALQVLLDILHDDLLARFPYLGAPNP